MIHPARCCPDSAWGQGERGIALVLVLWVIALLTVMAVALTATQRTETALTGNEIEVIRFRALSDAALSHAVLKLLAPPPLEMETEDEVWIADGSSHRWSFAGETLAISVFNETSRIDLNAAPQARLEALLLALEVQQDLAAALADQIVDWRDEDDSRLLLGAEDADYEAAGRSYGAKDRRFDTVEELQQVLDMTPELYRRMAPALSTDAEAAEVDEALASPLVRAALRGITLEEAMEGSDARAVQGLAESEQTGPFLRGGPLYRVRVSWLGHGQARQTMEALLRLERGASPPYRLLWRRTGLSADLGGVAALDSPQ